MDYLKCYKKMISLRGLTDHTMKSYSTYITAYLDFVQNTLHKYPSQVTYPEILMFLDVLQAERGLADRTVNTSQEEVKTFISTFTDLKPKAMVALMYSAGLRIGEVCSLRCEDIQRKNMRIHITHGKSRSDRFAILSGAALEILNRYWFACGRPREWIFPKQNDPSRPIDTFYLPRHIAAHERELGWPKRLTCHSFRHAFGTHLYENGTDLMTIKTLMGHKSLASTAVYVHLAVGNASGTVSPFDLMGGDS